MFNHKQRIFLMFKTITVNVNKKPFSPFKNNNKPAPILIKFKSKLVTCKQGFLSIELR